MSKSLEFSQFKAWEVFITRHSKIIRSIEKHLEQHKEAIPLHWYDILFVLSRSQDRMRRMSDIADMTITSRSALTRAVDKLVDEGYVKKHKCDKDGRGLYAALTPEGLKALKRTWPLYKKAIHEHFGKHLSTTDAKTLIRILSPLTEPCSLEKNPNRSKT